jgi:hypothetical protein
MLPFVELLLPEAARADAWTAAVVLEATCVPVLTVEVRFTVP